MLVAWQLMNGPHGQGVTHTHSMTGSTRGHVPLGDLGGQYSVSYEASLIWDRDNVHDWTTQNIVSITSDFTWPYHLLW